MDQEIHTSRFTQANFKTFQTLLCQETELLKTWFQNGTFASTHEIGGFELETYLVAADMSPAPIAGAFLKRLEAPLVRPDMATFQRRDKRLATGAAGGCLESCLASSDARLAMIDILPAVATGVPGHGAHESTQSFVAGR